MFAAVAAPASGRDWHVNHAAAAAADGTTPETAWRRLADIAWSAIAPGDTIWVRGGPYDERVVIGKSGVPGARITLKGDGRTVIRGVNGGSHDHVAVIGFEITHTSSAQNYEAVRLAGSDGWLIQDNYIHHTVSSGVNGSYGTVNNRNIVRGNIFEEITAAVGGATGAPTIQFFGDYNLVEYNTFLGGLERIRFHGTGCVARNNYMGFTDAARYPMQIKVLFVTMNNGGAGYTTPPTVTFSAPSHPGGVRATGTAVVSGGRVTGVTMTNVGSGYTNQPTVTFSGGGGSGALATAVRDPFHIDGFHGHNVVTPFTQFIWERNWDENNTDSIQGTNAKGFLLETPSSTNPRNWAVLRFNVIVRTGGVAYQFNSFSRIYGYNLTSIAVNHGSPQLFRSAVTFDHATIGDVMDMRNNTWSDSPRCISPEGIITTSYRPTNFTSARQHAFNYSGSQGILPTGASPGNLPQTDPLFLDRASDDYRLQQGSPLRNQGAAITNAVGSGSGSTTLTVVDSRKLFDGWTIAEGDILKIGSGAYVRVVSIDYANHRVTLAEARSWSAGDGVWVKGSEDVGALPFAFATPVSVANTTATTLPAGDQSLSATVGDPNAVRMVEFLVDGVPVGVDYDPTGSTYSVRWSSDGRAHRVEARAYNAWASKTLWAKDSVSVNESVVQTPTSVPPSFTSQPEGQSTTEGGSFSLIATASGVPAPTFQWMRNGSAIVGATSSTLSVTNATVQHAGTYTLVATNTAGNATSNGATVTVSAVPVAPVFSSQPASISVRAGEAATFYAAASGSPTYQWQHNGTNLGGATTATLQIASVSSSNEGTYRLVATNSAGATTSLPATLTVTSAPVFSLQPRSQTVAAGATVTLESSASGAPAVSYQWRKDGAAISGATNAIYTMADITTAAAGGYSVVATNTVGSATSVIATVAVTVPTQAPVFSLHPTNTTASAGSTVTLRASASGLPAPSYQWRKDGVNVSGATSENYTIANVGSQVAGTYTVVAQNSAGSATSNPAMVTIIVPPVFSVQPLSQTLDAGNTLTLTASASGVPAPTYQWRKDGVPVAGATGSSFSRSNVASADTGVYTVMATNSAGSSTSSGATVTIRGASVPPSSRFDFNSDGSTDVIWNNRSTGEFSVWLMNRLQHGGTMWLGQVSTAWELATTGNFNGESAVDLLWQNLTTREYSIWLMAGPRAGQIVSLGTLPAGWHLRGTGDFNGDGRTDILWHHPQTGEGRIWTMNGTTHLNTYSLPKMASPWRLGGVADLNGDGHADVLWQNTRTGATEAHLMNRTSRSRTVRLNTVGQNWNIGGTGDLNGDGHHDILWQDLVTGECRYWLMNRTDIVANATLTTVDPKWVLRN